MKENKLEKTVEVLDKSIESLKELLRKDFRISENDPLTSFMAGCVFKVSDKELIVTYEYIINEEIEFKFLVIEWQHKDGKANINKRNKHRITKMIYKDILKNIEKFDIAYC